MARDKAVPAEDRRRRKVKLLLAGLAGGLARNAKAHALELDEPWARPKPSLPRVLWLTRPDVA